jgi:hypothetical protein
MNYNLPRYIHGGAPPSYKLVISPLSMWFDISPTKTIVIGVICTNLAIERGHHLVYIYIPFLSQSPFFLVPTNVTMENPYGSSVLGCRASKTSPHFTKKTHGLDEKNPSIRNKFKDNIDVLDTIYTYKP